MASVWEHSSTRRVSGHFIHDGSRRPDTFPSSQNEAAITKFRLNREDRFLEFTAEVIVGALKENQAHGGMTRQDLRDAARLHIGNTGLLDHVLKAMNNVIVGNHVVSHSDPVTRILEYSIREVGNEANVSEPQKEAPRKLLTVSSLVPGLDVYNDLVDLFL